MLNQIVGARAVVISDAWRNFNFFDREYIGTMVDEDACQLGHFINRIIKSERLRGATIWHAGHMGTDSIMTSIDHRQSDVVVDAITDDPSILSFNQIRFVGFHYKRCIDRYIIALRNLIREEKHSPEPDIGIWINGCLPFPGDSFRKSNNLSGTPLYLWNHEIETRIEIAQEIAQ
mgnify:CR=1 FL=1